MDVTEVEEGLRELNDEIIRGYGVCYSILKGENMLTESAVVSFEKRHPKISSSST